MPWLSTEALVFCSARHSATRSAPSNAGGRRQMFKAKKWGRQMLRGDRGYVQVPSHMMTNYQAGWRLGWTLQVSGRE